MGRPPSQDVFALSEVALAAGVPTGAVEMELRRTGGTLLPGGFVGWDAAIALGRAARRRKALRELPRAVEQHRDVARALFASHVGTTRAPVLPAAVSAAAHGLTLLLSVLVTSAGVGQVAASSVPLRHDPMRLVFLATPGPGGGGGGGGLKQKALPPKAMRRGSQSLSSPVPARRPPDPVEATPPKPEPPPPPKAAEVVQAPVATVAADARDRAGVLEQTPSEADSRGPGAGGDVGIGSGTGIGEGQGSGIGNGEGGGTGGGPYRPGSGIEPPRLLREVKPDYTEEARRAGVTGEVLLEIVVRRDGTVGDVRVLRGLGRGLDGRAVDAVRQWRFSPARRQQAPVDVMVEVAVEFRLR